MIKLINQTEFAVRLANRENLTYQFTYEGDGAWRMRADLLGGATFALVGDAQKLAHPDKKVNYTAVAIKGLLLHYKPTTATVTVDGQTHTYRKAWLAPAMKGRYYGGGMNATPNQDRTAPDGHLSVMLFHGKGRLATLMAFPSIFKGEHIQHTNMVAIHEGYDIRVVFDSPRAVQIDGETIPGVTEYRAYAAQNVKEPAHETASAETLV